MDVYGHILECRFTNIDLCLLLFSEAHIFLPPIFQNSLLITTGLRARQGHRRLIGLIDALVFLWPPLCLLSWRDCTLSMAPPTRPSARTAVPICGYRDGSACCDFPASAKPIKLWMVALHSSI